MAYRLGSRLAALGGASFLSLISVGCEPPPENVGVGLSTDDGGTSTGTPPEGTSMDAADEASSDESSGGEPHVGPEPKWEVLLESRTGCMAVEPMPDGGVAIIAEDFGANDLRVRRYAPDGTLLWEQPEGSKSFSLDALPDGRLVVGGSSIEDPIRAAVWLLSPEGDVLATYVPPPPNLPADETWVSTIDADPSGVAFVVQHFRPFTDYEQQDYELAFAGLDLEPHWWVADFKMDVLAYQVIDVQLGASGSIRTLEVGPGDRLRSFAPTGELESETLLADDVWSARLANGDPGVLLEQADGEYRLRGLEERPDLDLVVHYDELGIDPPESSPLGIFHSEGGLLLGTTMDARHTLWASQLDADGMPIYERSLEPDMDDFMFMFAIAPGPDDSIYFCGSYSGQGHGFLSRRYPAW